MEYQYPIADDWSTDEIIDVVRFFETIEQTYEKGVKQEQMLEVYRRFKEIVPGKAQEKQLCAEFEAVSGYSFYRTMKKAKEADSGTIIRMQS